MGENPHADPDFVACLVDGVHVVTPRFFVDLRQIEDGRVPVLDRATDHADVVRAEAIDIQMYVRHHSARLVEVVRTAAAEELYSMIERNGMYVIEASV